MTGMTDKVSLLELATRVEAATGPDREIDGAIDSLLNDRPKDGDYHEAEQAIWHVDGHSGLAVRGDGFARDSFCAQKYTTSLDAAMTLAGPQRAADIIHIGSGNCLRATGDSGSKYLSALPRHVCAAALRALASQEQSS
jgi:hypothetical protein